MIAVVAKPQSLNLFTIIGDRKLSFSEVVSTSSPHRRLERPPARGEIRTFTDLHMCKLQWMHLAMLRQGQDTHSLAQ